MFSRSLLAATLLSAIAVPAQQPSPDVATIKVSARIVVLDVVVTDKKGNIVNNLTRDDFAILEDKAPQTIRSFEQPSAHAMPPGDAAIVHSATDLPKIGNAPVTLLVLDELNTRFEDMSFARNSLIKYLQAQPPVLRQPTTLLIATNTKFVQVRDYTQDRDTLINDVKKHLPEFPWRMTGSGKQGAGAVERMAQSLAALEQIAQSTIGTPGRKNVIWVGAGFPSADLVGLDDKTVATIETAVRQCTNELLAARITMYSINPAANTTTTVEIDSPDDLDSAQNENGAEFSNGQVNFTNFAPATGGLAFQSRNDINNEIAEGIAAGANYYTLSYSPTNHTDDAAKYRNIRIVMKDPSLHATTRNGYYPETASSAASPATTEPPKQARAQLQLDLSNAVTSTIAYNGLTIAAAKGSSGAYTITVPGTGEGLTWQAASTGGEKTEATVMAAWYDSKGKLLGHTARELTASRTAPPADATFTLPVTLPSDVARLRFIVRDAVSGRMGTTDLTKL